MARVSGEIEPSSRRIRIAWVVVPLCIIGAMGLMFSRHSDSDAWRKRQIKEAIRSRDWTALSELLPPIELHFGSSDGGTVPRDRFAAFLTRYIDESEPLIFESEDESPSEEDRVDVWFGKIGSITGRKSLVFSIYVAPVERSPHLFPVGVPYPYDFQHTFMAIAEHRFPVSGLQGQKAWSLNSFASEYLFLLREKESIEGMKVPFYSLGGTPSWDCDRQISMLEAILKSEGVDVAKLEKDHGLSDFGAPAKDSRRI